jgi:pimeloyl-ACP methyl ester carboxylesterase
VHRQGFTGNRHNWGYDEGGTAWLLANDPAFNPPAGGARLRVVLVESRGAGESRGAAGPFTIAQQASDVLALATHLGVDTFTFCGHSMGGGVGWHLLGAAPHRLNRVVLLAPIPSFGVPSGAAPISSHLARTHPMQYFGFLPVPSQRDVLERLAIVEEGRERDTEAWRQQRAEAVAGCSEEYDVVALRTLACTQRCWCENCSLPTLGASLDQVT